ncbi:NADH-ubiquinone oxidoreductase-F iron-sulfur binding region domain-containing protein [Nocardia jiangxiensis]|uniref:NADH-ubiquinone oxidoreductase-F iron-sulfur binding region domain-containing protein n=1 Tax=Nocardia jiangxiensis TaxID=282685 RepID=A0ABW6RTM6_9NOCA|nr:NADH-ubiquinone oxidoreductase-F iron-sulfur binding region domain-containing protein [Nocardia jiangxiensis]
MQEIFDPVGVLAAPGIEPRLLRAGSEVEDLAAYRASGGYRASDSVAELLEEIRHSGLRGRGGAAFPTAIKLGSVRDAHLRGSATVVVANGEEGEPASVKDRWLLCHRPHLVLDGLRLAAAIAGAAHAYVYVSDAEAARRVDAALTELDGTGLIGVRIELVTVAPGYVAGEETAAIRAINGGPAKPSDKPPRPFESGVDDLPTAVSNVETLANLPFIHRHGGQAFREEGTAGSPGTFLITVTGAGRGPGLYELPHGARFADLLALHRISPQDVRGALMGGYFSGMADRAILDATLDHEAIRGLGYGLGCGAISLITGECPVAVAASVLGYFDRENAGQCGSCFNGTAAMAAVAAALRDGRATDADVERLQRWSVVLRGRGACGTLDGACNTAATLLTRFPAEVATHLDGRCPDCAQQLYLADRPFDARKVLVP